MYILVLSRKKKMSFPSIAQQRLHPFRAVIYITGIFLLQNWHHTEADYIGLYDPDECDRTTAVWAVYTWAIADMEDLFPRLK